MRCKILNPRTCIVQAAIIFLSLGSSACSHATPEQKGAKFLASGKALVEKKEYARAILEFKNATRLIPNDAEPLYQMGLRISTRETIRPARQHCSRQRE